MSDVVVIGAGLAGLAAARRLVAAGHEVTVVEARERVGGRTEGLLLEDGTPLELGGQWVGEGHTRVNELIGELGLSTFRTWNDEGQLLVHLNGKRSTAKPHKGAVPRLSPFALADLLQGMLRFGRLAARTDLERPWLTPGAEVLDGQTWESWIHRNLRTRVGRAYFHIACEAVFAAQASDVSLLHALFYTHSNADLETLLAVDGGGQQDRVTGGSVLVAEAMAAALGERVVLGRPVRRIEQDDDGVTVITRDGTRYRGDAAIVTLPPALAGRLEYDPPLPSWRDQLTQRTPAGSVIKAYAIYPEPFWRQDGPVKVTFDNSPPSGTPGVLMGFLEGKEARLWAQRSQAERQEAVTGCFVRYFGPQAARPRQYVERDWMAEEFTRGCYGAHFGPGTWTSYGQAWRAPAGRIHWAGAECAPQWNGYMEGAVRSGEAAADVVARDTAARDTATGDTATGDTATGDTAAAL
jgi:monoamine oxidase